MLGKLLKIFTVLAALTLSATAQTIPAARPLRCAWPRKSAPARRTLATDLTPRWHTIWWSTGRPWLKLAPQSGAK